MSATGNDLESFRAELARAGIIFDGQFNCDGNVHRYKARGDRKENSWYVVHLYPTLAVGAYGCWKTGVSGKWSSKAPASMSKEEWALSAQAQKDQAAKRAAEEQAKQAKARARAQSWFAAWKRAKEGDSLYLALKGVPVPHGPLYVSEFEVFPGWLALPLQDIDGAVHTTEFIADDGTKQYQWGGRKQGCYFPVSDVPGGPILVCEGYATGASLYEATRWTVICAMDKGNLLPVGKALRAKYPSRSIVLCADNDQFTEGNPGLTAARAAAKAINGLICYPDFADEALADKPTDFNDLHANEGLAEVNRQVLSAFPVVARPIGTLQAPPDNDPTELLKYRYLCECGALLVNGSTGLGKCLGEGTPVLLFDGRVIPVEAVQNGDRLMGPDSNPRTVIGTCSGHDELYRVTPTKGDPYVCNSRHVLTLRMTRTGEIVDIPVQEYLRKSTTFKHCAKGFRAGVDWANQKLSLPPYFLGVWLGDGTSDAPAVTTPNGEIIRYIKVMAHCRRMRTVEVWKRGCCTITMRAKVRGRKNEVLDALRDLAVLRNKRIPLRYLANSRAQRLELLAGLMDSDGYLGGGCYEIVCKRERLASDIAFLARSLGFMVTIAPSFKTCQTGRGGIYQRVVISGDLSVIPVKLAYKKAAPRRQKKNVLNVGIKVEPIGRGRYYGFETDGDHRFLLGDFTVTHNSSIAIQAAACWANTIDFFGIIPSKPLRTVVVQAENDDGDVAQMRDGICRGLGLVESQRRRFFDNVLVYSSRGLTGRKFCQEVLRPLLDLHSPNLLVLDPMLAFLGGNVKEQEVVGEFLREFLNPLLFESKAACMGMHHTNKPLIGKEKGNWVNGEMAYTGSGSAEWANWARAILAVQSTGIPGYYTMHAAKRGGRLGWSTTIASSSSESEPEYPAVASAARPSPSGDNGELPYYPDAPGSAQPKPDPNEASSEPADYTPLYEKPIAWSREKGVIYWRTPSPEELEGIASGERGPGGRPLKTEDDAILALIGDISMTTPEWARKAKDELNVPRSNFYRAIKRIEKNRQALKSAATERWSRIIPKS